MVRGGYVLNAAGAQVSGLSGREQERGRGNCASRIGRVCTEDSTLKLPARAQTQRHEKFAEQAGTNKVERRIVLAAQSRIGCAANVQVGWHLPKSVRARVQDMYRLHMAKHKIGGGQKTPFFSKF